MNTHISRIGFEIEGEFSGSLSSLLQSTGKMVSDGSVHPCRGTSDEWHSNLSTAEYNSPAYRVHNPALPLFWEKMQNAYAAHDYHYNDSAGYHVHVSFRPQFPPELFSRQFADYFITSLKKEFPEVWKAREKSRWCKPVVEEEIAFGRNANGGGDRYRAINLWPAMKKHKTVEFRIFPAAEPARMAQYLAFTISTIEKFLKKTILVRTRALIDAEPLAQEYAITGTVMRSQNISDISANLQPLIITI